MLIVHDLFDLDSLAFLGYFSLGPDATGEFCHIGRHLARAITILPGAVAADDYSFVWHFAGGQLFLRDKMRKPVLSAHDDGLTSRRNSGVQLRLDEAARRTSGVQSEPQP